MSLVTWPCRNSLASEPGQRELAALGAVDEAAAAPQDGVLARLDVGRRYHSRSS